METNQKSINEFENEANKTKTEMIFLDETRREKYAETSKAKRETYTETSKAKRESKTKREKYAETNKAKERNTLKHLSEFASYAPLLQACTGTSAN